MMTAAILVMLRDTPWPSSVRHSHPLSPAQTGESQHSLVVERSLNITLAPPPRLHQPSRHSQAPTKGRGPPSERLVPRTRPTSKTQADTASGPTDTVSGTVTPSRSEIPQSPLRSALRHGSFPNLQGVIAASIAIGNEDTRHEPANRMSRHPSGSLDMHPRHL